MIVVVNYGLGNVGSLLNMMEKIGADAMASSDLKVIEQAEKLILPGVGSFDRGIENLESLGLVKLLEIKCIKEKVPIMGICLGMQLFTRCSEEGSREGLGWINADTVRFKFNEKGPRLRIPHMGWNTVESKKRSVLFNESDQALRYYFGHSYHVICEQETDILAETNYGYNFPSAILKDNIVGVQFHPEKSHKFGLNLLKSFVERF
jgi:glutamine amidotransferase